MADLEEAVVDRSAAATPPPLGKHGHAIAAFGSGIELLPRVEGDHGSMAMGAVFPRAIGQIGNLVPIHGANEAEVAGGDHFGSRNTRSG